MSAVLKESPMVFDMIDAAGPGQPLAEVPQATRISTSQPIDLTQITPMTLLQIAVERGNTQMEVLERLMAKASETAFDSAMAEFKLEPPIILKTKRVYFEGRDGGATTDYHHATHADVTVPIIKGLAKVGITHMWVPEQRDGNVFITCVLSHFAGHSKRVTMFSGPDSTGNKKGVQSIVSTKTYLERHTLLAITGLTTDDMPDDDGRGGGDDHSDGGAPFDTDERRDVLRERTEKKGPAGYPAEAFDKNLPAWRDLIASGRKTAEQVIAIVASKGALSTEQVAVLQAIKPKGTA